MGAGGCRRPSPFYLIAAAHGINAEHKGVRGSRPAFAAAVLRKQAGECAGPLLSVEAR